VLLREVRARHCGDGRKQSFFHLYLYKQYERDRDVPLNWVLSSEMADYIWNGAMNEGCNQQELDRLKGLWAYH
jgi:hypothetical protein